MPLFSNSYALSFFFKEKDLEMLNNIRVVIIEEEEVEIYNDITYNALGSEIKENKTRKDYNASTGSIRVKIEGVFFY
jgi:hypothetical protein